MSTAYGTYDVNSSRDDGKKVGVAQTKRAPVTLALWEDHLAGGHGLGIVPIREDSTCVFGAIDVDIYNLDHRTLVVKLKRSNIPLVVCRTKSGGAHLYCFSRQPIPASAMRIKLGEVASLLGYGKQEIFPKQSHILVEQSDVGSWINVPYFSGVRGMRYAVDMEGNALTPEQFLRYADECRQSPEWFNSKLVLESEFEDGPPCLQALSQVGYPTGSRNNGLYNIGVYLKLSQPDDWERALDQYNYKYMSPPLLASEVQGVSKSLRKKDYTYSCSREPICSHCNATLCRTRKFGVGSGANGKFPTLGGLSKLNTRPPVWFWEIDGTRMELATEDLQDPRRFQRKCMESLNLMPPMPSAVNWQAAVQHAMDGITIIEASEDSSPEGQFWEAVEKFCTGRAQAISLEEVVLGKPYTEGSRTYFRLQDLQTFLTHMKLTDFKRQKIASMLRDVGADHTFKNLKGRGTNLWSLRSFNKQTQPFDVPKEVVGKVEPF
jgi:hypothetical protein